MQLSEKQKLFFRFFSQFWNLDQILKILKKKMTLIGDVFLDLRTPQNLIR